MNEMIETESLRFAYPADEGGEPVFALRGVDLTIEKGSFVVVLGHNGSGKSTLAKTFNAVLLPAGGKVYVEGMDTLDEGLLLAIRQRVGMVFQNPDNQIVANVVEEDVAFAPENLGVPTEEIRRRVDEALRTVGMYDFVRHAPHLLSGGQKQRIAIAGVLAMEPECIVLDEATAMLDPVGRQEVLFTVLSVIFGGLGPAIILFILRDRVPVSAQGGGWQQPYPGGYPRGPYAPGPGQPPPYQGGPYTTGPQQPYQGGPYTTGPQQPYQGGPYTTGPQQPYQTGPNTTQWSQPPAQGNDPPATGWNQAPQPGEHQIPQDPPRSGKGPEDIT